MSTRLIGRGGSLGLGVMAAALTLAAASGCEQRRTTQNALFTEPSPRTDAVRAMTLAVCEREARCAGGDVSDAADCVAHARTVIEHELDTVDCIGISDTDVRECVATIDEEACDAPPSLTRDMECWAQDICVTPPRDAQEKI